MDRKVFEFIENLAPLTDAASVTNAMGELLEQHGIDHFCLSFLPGPNQSYDDVAIENRMPDGYVPTYIEKQYTQDDPVFHHCKTTVLPFRWYKETPIDPERQPRAVEVVRLARDFGMVDGVVVPVASAAGRMGQVWFGGREFDLPEYKLPALHLMAHYAFDRLLRLKGVPSQPEHPLSPREREVLTFVALGMTSAAIAARLSITERTVIAHIAHCCRKLGAATRTQAVAIAVRDGIIQPW
ncbi:LuxR family transcriptional regulator [Bradyrhizobium sp. CCGUVB1N3]|uniref:helix-turn-helix transcriptional regulator n=1 Tax=Bradyrhizobium sp. CCGUVB1N3 TaxID=2949629 RepID=UPI0020B1E067|nr:LuxR family transcriptional regulator [Bradyrhizobium sp. CCGUVB1N3]MCP3471449.1 LuxR family transcriptional regulator [Bradyrhizobium sp. CCGUVB1N3]